MTRFREETDSFPEIDTVNIKLDEIVDQARLNGQIDSMEMMSGRYCHQTANAAIVITALDQHLRFERLE